MSSLCGANCAECGYYTNSSCKGCKESDGCPFGKQCFIAKYISVGGMAAYSELVSKLASEFDSLGIEGLPKITELYPMTGAYVNLAYPLPNGETAKLLDDREIYLCNQVECEFSCGEACRCYGLVASMDFLLVAEYGENGINPVLIAYKKR